MAVVISPRRIGQLGLCWYNSQKVVWYYSRFRNYVDTIHNIWYYSQTRSLKHLIQFTTHFLLIIIPTLILVTYLVLSESIDTVPRNSISTLETLDIVPFFADIVHKKVLLKVQILFPDTDIFHRYAFISFHWFYSQTLKNGIFSDIIHYQYTDTIPKRGPRY